MLGWLLVAGVIVLLIVCLFFLFDDFAKSHRDRKKFEKKVYNILKYYADEQDHLLLNDVNLYLDEDKRRPTIFNHILFADKYIYVITDFSYRGGIYGNIQDGKLFVKEYDGNTLKVSNPIMESEQNVMKLENFLGIHHSDKMLVSVVVHDSNLIVPKEIEKKEQTSWFLPVSELEKTMTIAEQDDVAPISHEQTEKMVHTLLERSNLIKKEIKKYQERK
jgi:hypothetical protein